MDSHPEIEIELTTLAHGGEALGRFPDGRAVFVPFALPGEHVRARVVSEKNRYLRAELVEILKPAPERVEPVCAHYGLCGGCHLQHLAYEAQTAAKAGILRDQLQRIGRIDDPPVQTTAPSSPWNYRNHVQFHLTPEGKLGYYTYHGEGVFPIQECHLPQPLINQVWLQLDFEALPELERIGVREGVGEDFQIILESSDLSLPEISLEDLDVSVIHVSPAGSLVLAGSPAVNMEVLERPFKVSAASFFQVNTRLAEEMVKYLLRSVEIPTGGTVLDVFCGVGMFSAFLAPRAGRLIGIEASPYACEDFIVNLEEYDNVELYEAPAEDVLPVLDVKPDLILVDPPRTGMQRRALDGLVSLGAPAVVYISCDPATLARDAHQLAAQSYRLISSTPFDLFPQTYHIESINIFLR
jgi:23S rRNA (uracil1939-C5)-methyltransferase